MKVNTILNRYVFKEMLPPFGLNVLFFTFIFLMAQMLEITNWIVNYNISVFTVLLLIFYSTPYFLVFVIPMSVMMTVLLTILRMSSDNEIIALKSGGLSLYGLLPPVLLICLIGSGITCFMTLYGLPWGQTAIKRLSLTVATANVDIGLKERTFNDAFKDVMLYVNEIDMKNRTLIDVFIEDKRKPDIISTVIAPKGKLLSEPEKFLFHLKLFNGTIHQTNLEDRSANSIQFNTYDLTLDLKKAVAEAKEKPKGRSEMNLSELRRFIRDLPVKNKTYYKALLEFHRKFSIPVACFALGLLAVPLGMQSRSAKRSFGLVLGLVFFLVYYLMLSAGMVLGKTGTYPPAIGMWLPNAVMGVIGVYLFVQTARERSLKINLWARRFQRWITKFGR
ncbi:MAG: LPS export ABC transporter permease LptF [Desulfobacterales bacterium]|nr:MAG: LPS export ABC transporter permease LptF [Desulfobacterales bacterium]